MTTTTQATTKARPMILKGDGEEHTSLGPLGFSGVGGAWRNPAYSRRGGVRKPDAIYECYVEYADFHLNTDGITLARTEQRERIRVYLYHRASVLKGNYTLAVVSRASSQHTVVNGDVTSEPVALDDARRWWSAGYIDDVREWIANTTRNTARCEWRTVKADRTA